MTPPTPKSVLFTITLALVLFSSGCAINSHNPIPDPGTAVKSSLPAFLRTAQDIRDDCARIGGCTCIMDGIQTTCSLVFACLDAGFCEVVSADQ